MDEQEIKDNIEKATRVFKETLEETYLKKKLPFYDIGVHGIMNFFAGKVSLSRKKNGNLRICGELPAPMFADECKGLPRHMTDYNIFPLVITLFHTPDEEKQK